MTRLGFVSFAHLHAEAYARAARAIPGVELVAVHDPDAKRGRAAAKAHGLRFVARREDLWDHALDGVVVCSENARHRADVEAAAGAGVATLCEKPLATSPEDALAMVRACERAKVPLMTAFPCRFSTPLAEARRQVRDGRLGRVLAAVGTNRGTNPGGWFLDPDLAGGGAVTDHTVHVVDLLRWMLDDEIDQVFAEASGVRHEVEDHGLLMMRTAKGVGASLDCSWSRPPRSFPTWGDVTLQLVGEKGNLAVDAFAQHALLYSERAGKGVQVDFADDINAGLVENFVQVVRGEAEPAVTGWDGLRAVEVVEAAYRSIGEEKAVRVRRARATAAR